MKTTETGVCLTTGTVSAMTKDICRSLAQQGISTLIVPQESAKSDRAEITAGSESAHWSGKPGEDLFFNGWKLLF